MSICITFVTYLPCEIRFLLIFAAIQRLQLEYLKSKIRLQDMLLKKQPSFLSFRIHRPYNEFPVKFTICPKKLPHP